MASTSLTLCVLLWFVSVCLADQVVDHPIVQTSSGPIKGETHEYPAGRLSRYLGVPYGRPPVGSLRFTPPQTPEPWTDTLNTTDFPNTCYQNRLSIIENMVAAFGGRLTEISEDCLYLNVYVPLSENNEKKATMVWIHGGALTMGSGSDLSFEALPLAGDVIIVTINYRLDIFGFIATEDDRAPGNIGFLDQVLGLRWVQDNIAAFGGDPDKVTIFGESAGGWSVNAHMVSPLSRGLFTRAISQSGSLYGYLLETREERAERTRGLAASLDCPPTPEADMLTCLQDVPADKLLQAATKIQFLQTVLSPATSGGEFLPKDLTSLWDEHRFAPGVDYMLGANSEEALIFLLIIPPDQRGQYLSQGVGPNDLLYHIMLGSLTLLPSDRAHQVALLKESAFDQYLPDLGDKMGVFRGLLDGVADRMFIAPTLGAAAKMAEADQEVYLYYFDHPVTSKLNIPIANPEGAPELGLGANHGQDVAYVFAWPFLEGVPNSWAANTTEEDKAISRAMVHTWTNFAKTGKMTVLLDDGSEIEWPKYNKTTETYLEWKHPMTSSSLKSRLRARADGFWNVLIPSLLELDAGSKPASQCVSSVGSLWIIAIHVFVSSWFSVN